MIKYDSKCFTCQLSHVAVLYFDFHKDFEPQQVNFDECMRSLATPSSKSQNISLIKLIQK